MTKWAAKVSGFAKAIDADEKHFRVAIVATALLGFCLRVAHSLFVERALAGEQILDAAFYYDEARYLAGFLTEPLEPGATRFANPGYPYVLAFLFRWVGARPLYAMLAQSLLGALSTLALAATARALSFGRLASFFAAFVWAVYAPAIHFDASLLIPSTTAALTVVTSLASAYAMREVSRDTSASSGSRLTFVAAALISGLAIGAAAWLRPTNVLLLGALFVLPLAYVNGARKKVFVFAAFAALGVAALVVPRVLSQRDASGGELVPMSANGGMNFWLGNHAGASGLYDTTTFLATHNRGGRDYTVIGERNAYLDEARRRSGEPAMTLTQSSAFWRREALLDMRADPMRWLGLELRKLFRFANGREPRTNVSIEFASLLSPVLAFDPIGFGLLFVVGLCGLFELHRAGSRKQLVFLTMAILVPLAVCLLFFVNGELRHPAGPALALAAGVALSRWTLGEAPSKETERAAWIRRGVVTLACVCAFFPVARESLATEFKGFAEILASPRFDGTMPKAEDYERAEALLSRMGDERMDVLIRHESLLLVHSNRAIQFQDLDAARAFVETAKALWDLRPRRSREIPESIASRIVFNLRRRTTQLSGQPFLFADPELVRELASLEARAVRETNSGP